MAVSCAQICKVFYEGTSNKMAISNSLALKGIRGRSSIIVVDNEIEIVQLLQSTVVLSKKQLKEVLCFTGQHGDMWADGCMAHQIWKNEASYEQTSVFLLHLKFMRP